MARASLKDLNEVLFNVLAGGDKVRKASLGGIKATAEIVNHLGSTIEAVVLESIRAHDPDLAQKITDKMLTAAAMAIAECVSDEQLNANFIIPSVFDPRIATVVASAVRKANL